MWIDYILSQKSPSVCLSLCPSIVLYKAELWSTDACGDMNAMCNLSIPQPSTRDLTTDDRRQYGTDHCFWSLFDHRTNLSKDHLNSWNESQWQKHSNVLQLGVEKLLKAPLHFSLLQQPPTRLTVCNNKITVDMQ